MFTSVLLQVPAEKNIKRTAFTIIPLFLKDGYVAAGSFLVPLYSGALPEGLLSEVSAQGAVVALRQAFERGMIEPLKFASVAVRIVGGNRNPSFSKPKLVSVYP